VAAAGVAVALVVEKCVENRDFDPRARSGASARRCAIVNATSHCCEIKTVARGSASITSYARSVVFACVS